PVFVCASEGPLTHAFESGPFETAKYKNASD
ncbi:hypothetical protein D046_3860B, partial [Vibrio parahaemolyticus V-223/04]